MRVNKRLHGSATVALVTLVAPATVHAQDAPSVPGFEVEVYATLCTPTLLSFDEDGGFLYAGNAGCGGWIGGPAWVRRIWPGGAPVEQYGDEQIDDPDAVLWDGDGLIAPEPGSVLVGSDNEIFAILPDGAIVFLFGAPNTANMTFDHTGRLLILGFNPGRVFATIGGQPELLFQLSTAARGLAVDADDRIYTAASDGIVRIHAPDGTLLDGSFVTGLGTESHLEFGPGEPFGTDLHVVVLDGRLIQIDPSGNQTVIGSGFTGRPTDLAFGSNGDLFVAEVNTNRVLRISPACSADVTDNGTVDFADLLDLVSAWGECSNCQEDLNADGVVDFQDLLILLAAWGPC